MLWFDEDDKDGGRGGKRKVPASGGSTRGVSGRSRTARLLGTAAYGTPGFVARWDSV